MFRRFAARFKATPENDEILIERIRTNIAKIEKWKTAYVVAWLLILAFAVVFGAWMLWSLIQWGPNLAGAGFAIGAIFGIQCGL